MDFFSWFKPGLATLASQGDAQQCVQLFRGNVGSVPNDATIRTAIGSAQSNSHKTLAQLLMRMMAAKNNPLSQEHGHMVFAAAFAGDSELLGLFLDAGECADAVSSKGWSLLQCAVRSGSLLTVQCALGHGAATAGTAASNALVTASSAGATDIIQCLLDAGVSVNTPSNTGMPPLHAACEKGHAAAVSLLVQAGAHVGCVPSERGSQNSIHAALTARTPLAVATLVQLIPQAQLAGLLGERWTQAHTYPPLTRAAVHRQDSDSRALKALLESGAELHIHQTSGVDELSVFGRLCALRCSTARLAERFELLLQVPGGAAALNTPDAKGRYALHYASCNSLLSKAGFVRILEQCPPHHITAADNEGMTPLHLASEVILFEKVQALLAAGADPCAVNRAGLQPSQLAAAGAGHGDKKAGVRAYTLCALINASPQAVIDPSWNAAVLSVAVRYGHVAAIQRLAATGFQAGWGDEDFSALTLERQTAAEDAGQSQLSLHALCGICTLLVEYARTRGLSWGKPGEVAALRGLASGLGAWGRNNTPPSTLGGLNATNVFAGLGAALHQQQHLARGLADGSAADDAPSDPPGWQHVQSVARWLLSAHYEHLLHSASRHTFEVLQAVCAPASWAARRQLLLCRASHRGWQLST